MVDAATIRKLDDKVINRIAAGEIIQRPVNALKELIENSIDAKSTSIQIVVKSGGMKLLQIQDNGTGIRKGDLSIVCERFTTSKIKAFEDLSSLSTYGFRGEALASISHVAHLTIITKIASELCAYRCTYEDSKMVEGPQPCAGNQGTIIKVEDLFFNMPTRCNALNNFAEEYNKISGLVGKYAIHNKDIGFALKKTDENNKIRTPPKSNHIDNIRTVYGNDIARELVEIQCCEFDELRFKMHGYATNVNYSSKKLVFILFINHRLVESTEIRNVLVEVYNTYLPKNAFPFIYLSLEIDPANIDVNVHPTKHEVIFLHSELIIEKIKSALERKLLGSNSSRVFYTMSKLPGLEGPKTKPPKEKEKVEGEKEVRRETTFVRTDPNEQKLEKFFSPSSQKPNNFPIYKHPSERVDVRLKSITDLKKTIQENYSNELRKTLSDSVYVGCVDVCRSLFQHSTELYLLDTRQMMEELFYQIAIYDFQNFIPIKFSHPLPLRQLILMALDMPESSWAPEDGEKDLLADRAVKILASKAEMLREYFSFDIDENQCLASIPMLLENHVPETAGLPMFVLRLATEVDWDSEKECFHTFAKEMSAFYANIDEANFVENRNWKWVTEHVFYPAMKTFFLPPKKFSHNGTILEIANLPQLYKVFERC